MKVCLHHLIRGSLLAVMLVATGAASAQAHYHGELTVQANAIAFGSVVQPPSRSVANSGATPFSPLETSLEAVWLNQPLGANLRGGAVATVSVNPGVVRLRTSSSATVNLSNLEITNHPFANASGVADAHGFFRDVVYFDVPSAAPGDAFTAVARLRIDASSSLNGLINSDDRSRSWVAPSSSWSSRASMATSQGWLFENEQRVDCGWSGAMQCTGDAPGWADVSFTVINGSRIVLVMEALAKSFAGGLLAGHGSLLTDSAVDMGHTLGWGGLTSLTDSSGNRVADFSMIGLGSGVDFRYSTVSQVPEPMSAVLALAGLALLIMRRRSQGPGLARPDSV